LLNDTLYEKLNDRSFLREYREKLTKIIAQYENKLKSLGQEGLNVLAMNSLSAYDFKSKGSGPAAGFQKMKDLKFVLNVTTLKSTTELSAWVTASIKEPQKSRLEGVAESKLMPKMLEAARLVETQSRNYITAKLIVNQLYTLGILVDLRKAVKELCREKGIILISDSGHLLKDVIADSETPFVYEKTGSVYSHFMIDEFQDTSGLQWNNFRPLIGNSLSENSLSMVVGDVKQAIYRWRSGDWRLLAGKLGESFPAFGIQNEVLDSNWRSHGKIIRFNNTIFRHAPELLQQNMEEELSAAGIDENPVQFTIPEVYADSVQEVSNKNVSDQGYVRVRFLENTKDNKLVNEELILSDLVESVKTLQDKGVKAIEMAILVRDKKQARLIADLFLAQKSLPENLAYNFDILSGESLYIANSEVIGFIVSVLTGFLNPDDQVVKAETNYLYYQKIYPRLKETGKIPLLREERGKRKEEVKGYMAWSKEQGDGNPILEATLPEREAVEGSSQPAAVELPLPECAAVEGRFLQEAVEGRPESEGKPITRNPYPVSHNPQPETRNTNKSERGNLESGTFFEPDINQQFEELNLPENELIQFIASKNFEELIAGKPILEIIYSICEKFNLFSLADELAYLQAFVDQISVFERNHVSELTSFLNWWDENGARFTIPVSDSIDAINVLTIHKSKGLEFTHVFVPFFDWSIQPHSSPEMAPLLWCKPDVEPFNEMELVPVRYKNEVGQSIFYREFFAEKFNTYVDNLNLMYVVFTRAKAGLWIWASFSNKLNTVGDLLKRIIEMQSSLGSFGLNEEQSVQFSATYDPDKLLLEIGEVTVSVDDMKKNGQIMKDVRLSEFEFADFRKFLNIRQLGEDFFSNENKRQSGINKGKLIHEILSLVETTNDLHKAVKRIEVEGKIATVDAEKMIVDLTELLNDPEVKTWFDGTYRVVNERNILTGINGVKRPDRIMIGEDGVVVVDYKSGDTESDKYKYQLRTYMKELKNCGFPNVSGYIWYTKTNKRVVV